MSDHRKLAHLQEQLGDARYQALIDPSNTGKVRAFCDGFLEAALPTEMTIGGRTYEILPILRGKEEFVRGDTMVARGKEMEAHLGKDDGEYLLENQADIPVALRGKVAFVFTNWPRPDGPGDVAVVCWVGGRWIQDWDWLGSGWYGLYRVLRRKSK